MVAMRGVIVGRKHRGVEAAGAIAHVVEEGGAGIGPLPVARDGDPPAVGKSKARDVDRVGAGVFASGTALAAVEAAARIAAEMIDRRDRHAKPRLRGGLHDVPFP